ncbi:MAG: hypothetical protein BMS9Abin15_0464 [Gammaproteobacteria bacterium]|nr:MAG: hypothetical protein BMS9Abin15_0464 [Gammaproteobacteria bacterium]
MCLVLLVALTGAALSAELKHSTVSRSDSETTVPRYRAEVEVLLAIPIEQVRSMLENPVAFSRLNPAIYSIEQLPGEIRDDQIRVRIRTVVCVLLFCVDYTNVADVAFVSADKLTMAVLPALSDFSYGQSTWRINRVDAGTTRLRYHTEIEPSFWVPPIIGIPLMEQRLGEIAAETAQAMECQFRAAAVCAKPGNHDPAPSGYDDQTPPWD